jgi:hypothetical protein
MDFYSFEQLERLLYNLATKPGRKPIKGQSMDGASPLISPSIYAPDTTRANDNVVQWAGWAALDVDEHDFTSDNMEEELRKLIGGHYYVCYSTASSKVEHPKFRLVFPLTEPVIACNIKAFWYALNLELGQVGDKQTKDLSRMFYVPAQYPDAHCFIYTNKGSYMDPNLLMKKHPFIDSIRGKSFLDKLPPAIKDSILKHKQKQLTNDDVSWSTYIDCPFVSKHILNEFIAISNQDGTGRYQKIQHLMVSIAGNALKMKYPITSTEVATLISQIDLDHGARYQKRPLVRESENALQYAYTRV